MNDRLIGLPGIALLPEDERRTIREIRERWGSSLVNVFARAPHRPASLYTFFSPSAIITDRSAIQRLAIKDAQQVLLYKERPYPGAVTKTTFGQTKAFVASFPEFGHRSSYYIVPPSLEWCIAYTDDEIKAGHKVLLEGLIPVNSRE